MLIIVDMLLADEVGGVGDDGFGESDVAGYLHGETAACLSDGELEEGAHLPTVVEHGAVDDGGCLLGEVLEVGIVGGDDAKSALADELGEDGFGDGATNEVPEPNSSISRRVRSSAWRRKSFMLRRCPE